jgi:ParB/RepB/Spo0J family partition protein
MTKVKKEKIGTLEPNPYNPNRQDEDVFELLCKSISEDGFTQPILVHTETRQIIDGEHRWRAARHLGMKMIPVVFADMTPEQMRIATLRHNRARGEEEEDLTAAIFRELEEMEAIPMAQESLMMDDEAIQKILGNIETPEIEIPEIEETETFHVNLTYKGDQAEIMKRALGKDPTGKVWMWATN